MYQGAVQNPDRPGITTVYAHGSPKSVNDFAWFKKYGKRLTPLELAEKIRNSGQWKLGMPIWLKACSTGNSDRTFAQDLADAMRTTVFAPDKWVWFGPNGPVGVAGKKGDPKNPQMDMNDIDSYGQFVPKPPK